MNDSSEKAEEGVAAGGRRKRGKHSMVLRSRQNERWTGGRDDVSSKRKRRRVTVEKGDSKSDCVPVKREEEKSAPKIQMGMRSLPCGHKINLEDNVDISTYKCQEKCQRLLMDCEHPCRNLCHEPCGPCKTKVVKMANCGHEQTVICGSLASKVYCRVLVRAKVAPICGHINTRVPCSVDDASPEKVAEHCQIPCTHQFTPVDGKGCAHQCSGSCSACLQGRIHMKCQAPCDKQLVCGHRCEVPCASACPPCQKKCLMKCEHRECDKKCGEPCSNCEGKCSWTCPHASCTKLCGEPCDREPCYEPCPKKLKCGHDCVGFCGEPCPPLCRKCDREELTEILFGTEDDEDARFVHLIDCDHTIEASALETFLNEDKDNGLVQAKECPKCRTRIRNCRRFKVIRELNEDVNAIKLRAFGNMENSAKMRDKWIEVLCDFNGPVRKVFPKFCSMMLKHLVVELRRPCYTRDDIKPKTIDEFSMSGLDFIGNSAAKAATELRDLKLNAKLLEEDYEELVASYRKTLHVMLKRHPLSSQEGHDFNDELDKADYFKQLMTRRPIINCQAHREKLNRILEIAKVFVASPLPLNEIRKETFLRLLNELDVALKCGLGITKREKMEIMTAFGTQGRWYKCVNGHFYLIGECGRAMVESYCNECGARIGGSNHRLRDDNFHVDRSEITNQPQLENEG